MSDDQQRINDALRSGYLDTTLQKDDVALKLWRRVAAALDFPLVTTTPKPAGIVVTFIQNDGTPSTDPTLSRAMAMATRVCRRHIGARVEPDQAYVLMIGPLPIKPATALARDLARITGMVFPVTDYNEE